MCEDRQHRQRERDEAHEVRAFLLRADGPDVVGEVPAATLPVYRDRLDKPLPVGNEGAGTVVAAGPDAGHLLGRRVALFGGRVHHGGVRPTACHFQAALLFILYKRAESRMTASSKGGLRRMIPSRTSIARYSLNLATRFLVLRASSCIQRGISGVSDMENPSPLVSWSSDPKFLTLASLVSGAKRPFLQNARPPSRSGGHFS